MTKSPLNYENQWFASAKHSGITLRLATSDDREFLLSCYSSARSEEMLMVPWSQDEKDAFLKNQFELQDSHYRQHYQDAEFLVIEKDGVSAGRIYVCQFPDRLQLMEITVLEEFRGQGIGTALITKLCEMAVAHSLKVQLHVEAFNPAVRIYQRLGFRMVSDGANVYECMELTEDSWNKRRKMAC